MYTNIAGVPICIVCQQLAPASKTTSLADYQCTCSDGSTTQSANYQCSYIASTAPVEYQYSASPTNSDFQYTAATTNSDFQCTFAVATPKAVNYRGGYSSSPKLGYQRAYTVSGSPSYESTCNGSTTKAGDYQREYTRSKSLNSPNTGSTKSVDYQRTYSSPKGASTGYRCTFSNVTPPGSSQSMEDDVQGTTYTRRLSRRLSTSPAGGAIDNKIEQAMDLVKSHLLFAVREEVEVLKEQIKILVEKNEMLQEENSTLKQRLQQTQPQPGLQQQQQVMPNQQQQQNINMEQPTYTSMPNQMGQASLGQNPLGQTISDHAAYPQHPRATQQTHSTPNPGGLPEATPQYTPQGGIDSQQGQYQGMHSQQMHIGAGQGQGQPPQTHLSQGGMQDRSKYSQVTGAQPAPQQTAPQQMQGQYQTTMAPGGRQNANH